MGKVNLIVQFYPTHETDENLTHMKNMFHGKLQWKDIVQSAEFSWWLIAPSTQTGYIYSALAIWSSR